MTADSLRFGDDLAAFADSVIGSGLSPQVRRCAGAQLDRAGCHAVRVSRAGAGTAGAGARRCAQPPAPLIALYRFFFYGHQLDKARAVGEDALAIARTALGPNFGDEPPSDEATRHDAAVRFYLFALKGLAYLNMRLGDMDEARLMLAGLRRLDPKDHVGGGLLAHVLARHEAGGPTDTSPEYPARGWGATTP